MVQLLCTILCVYKPDILATKLYCLDFSVKSIVDSIFGNCSLAHIRDLCVNPMFIALKKRRNKRKFRIQETTQPLLVRGLQTVYLQG